MKTLILSIVACVLTLQSAYNQSIDSTHLLKAEFVEKVYLHTDRSLYSAGDDLWFKAYLVNAANNKLTNNSNLLYVELITPESKRLSRKLFRIENGLTNGDFHLPDSALSGTWRIRAYTQWMCNFGDVFLFEKQFKVVNSLKPIPSSKSKAEAMPEVQFFPEGGALVDGLRQKVAFKALMPNGKGTTLSGFLYDDNGSKLVALKSSFKGMGIFDFIPENGKEYTATGTAGGKRFSVKLPKVLENGYAMHIEPNDTMIDVFIAATRAEYEQCKGKTSSLLIQQNGKKTYQKNFVWEMPQLRIRLPRNAFASGILQLSLIDYTNLPQCERLVYNQNPATDSLKISINKRIYALNDSVVLKLKVTDIKNMPIKTWLSMCVVNPKLSGNYNNNIQTYLNLSSNLHGAIENPADYFDPKNSNRKEQLDLLVLTQGWRDFVWHQLADSNYSAKFPAEKAMHLTGSVRTVISDKPFANLNINMLLPGTSKDGLRQVKSDSTGFFDFGNLNIKGVKRLIVTSKDKNKDKGSIKIDSLYMKLTSTPSISKLPDEIDTSKINDFFIKSKKHYTLKDTVLLNQVTVNKKSTVDQIRTLEKSFKLSIQPEDSVFYNWGWYLGYLKDSLNIKHCAYGVEMFDNIFYPNTNYDAYEQTNESGYYNEFSSDEVDLTTMQPVNPIRFRINGEKVSYDVLRNIDMSQIERVEMDQYRNHFSFSCESDYSYRINIITKENVYRKKYFNTINRKVEGYYEPRIFYTSRYDDFPTKPEPAPLLFWHPNIITNDNGEAIVKFYNKGNAANIQCLVEGITSNGIPLSGNIDYEIK